MSTSTPPAAGGVLIALGAIGGTVVGLATAQPTLGFLIGTATGIMLALAIWWRARR